MNAFDIILLVSCKNITHTMTCLLFCLTSTTYLPTETKCKFHHQIMFYLKNDKIIVLSYASMIGRKVIPSSQTKIVLIVKDAAWGRARIGFNFSAVMCAGESCSCWHIMILSCGEFLNFSMFDDDDVYIHTHKEE